MQELLKRTNYFDTKYELISTNSITVNVDINLQKLYLHKYVLEPFLLNMILIIQNLI
jgi:hypothetical protein